MACDSSIPRPDHAEAHGAHTQAHPTTRADDGVGDPQLPGVGQVDPALEARLRALLAAKGSSYHPRTQHLEGGGAPTYVNRLIAERSPYLLQHAHNPVNWYPWGDEAFERARREGKPVFLSIGYSTCHWCHVMERESFEDVELAAYLNEHFIAIKVDREERPDIDDIYMTAVQMLTGHGGWPMTTILTPDRQPFFGGTYFPKPRLMAILEQIVVRYADDRDALVARARQLTRAITASSAPRPAGDVPGAEALENMARSLARGFDPVFGGIGGAPKFPQPARLMFLLRYYRRTSDAGALRVVRETLMKMADGGIYDQVGGGFHRYATDARWLVPHFEKMLYDNAQLVVVYLEAYQVTGEPRFAEIVRETLDYVAREMTSPEGGFYSATDADSPSPDGEDEEGLFFTWTPAEIEAVVGADEARVADAFWGVSSRGNFEGRTILSRPRPAAEVAAELRLSPTQLSTTIERVRGALYAARARRQPPLRDDKILTAWNGLMISAFARAALVLDEPRYGAVAKKAAEFVTKRLRDDSGALMRSYMDGAAVHRAYLDDHAFLIEGLLDLYELTGEGETMAEALRLQGALDDHYAADEGGYYMTRDDHEALLMRDRPSYDGAVPSGNSVEALNLLRIGEFTGADAARQKAERIFGAFSEGLSRGGLPRMLVALDFYLDQAREIVLVRPRQGSDVDLLRELRQTFLPNRVLLRLDTLELQAQASLLPILEGKRALSGRTTAYVCERGRCELPTSDPATFGQQLRRVRPLREGSAPSPLSLPTRR
ncbi:MAG: thioredoxin domain-containing protein [Deltaproteobacteria bacterium]|nr:thioredoxin domain-containing protein [Deltaproteobacteria bacterium]